MKKIINTTVNDKTEYHSFNDKPAIEWDDGDKAWYKEGRLHRVDGPACEFSVGYKCWCKEGVNHRLDGPAVECKDGYKEWWYIGKKVECSSTEEFLRIINLKVFW